MKTSKRVDKTTRRHIIAAAIGNVLEWYDFLIYGIMASVIARLFFPGEDASFAVLLTFVAFGLSFIVRPFGGILISYYADVRGRKKALNLIILMMTVAVALITFAPTYATIGVFAPFIIVLARLLQGLATGGEFSSATAFIVEHSPRHRVGFFASWQMAGQGLATLLAGIMGALVTSGLSPETLDAWGWRIPFAVGLLIGPVGIYIRRHLDETPAFVKAVKAGKRPSLVEVFTQYPRQILIGIGLLAGAATSNYTLIVYLPTYAQSELGIELGAALPATILSGAILVVTSLFFGHLSDRYGRKYIMATAMILMSILLIPAFLWMSASTGTAVPFYLSQVVFALLLGTYWGPFAAVLLNLYPTHIRSTSSAISYNVGVLAFGGFAPTIVVWLISALDTPVAPAYYVIIGTVISTVAAFAIPQYANRSERAIDGGEEIGIGGINATH